MEEHKLQMVSRVSGLQNASNSKIVEFVVAGDVMHESCPGVTAMLIEKGLLGSFGWFLLLFIFFSLYG